MLKIVIIITSLQRCGPTNVIFNMLEAYKSKEDQTVEFAIITLVKEKTDSRIDEFKKIGIKVKSLGYNNWQTAFFNMKEAQNAILQERPNICHSTGFVPDLILSRLRSKSIKRVTSVYNYPYEDFPMEFGKVNGNIMAFIQVRAIRNFDSVITCSHFIASKLSKCDLPLKVIYTGVPDSFFIPLSEKERNEVKAKLGVPLQKVVAIFIARFIPRKNAKFLVEAVKRAKNDRLFLLMMGDGEELDECKNILNDENKIMYLGSCPGTRDYLQVSDYYISPSHSEGFPTSVLEALSIGVQPILSDIAPHREMIENISPDMLFPLDNTDSLVQLLENLGKNNNSNSLRNYLLNNYSAIIMANNHISHYIQLYN